MIEVSRSQVATGTWDTAKPRHPDGPVMKGMATPEQMAELAAANATAFDRLFCS